jgi:hypothetical protein
MRKMILFFFMMMFRESECTDELREFFPLSFYFLEEEEDEIQQKYDTAIDEDVCTPCSTEYTTNPIDSLWEKSEQ